MVAPARRWPAGAVVGEGFGEPSQPGDLPGGDRPGAPLHRLGCGHRLVDDQRPQRLAGLALDQRCTRSSRSRSAATTWTPKAAHRRCARAGRASASPALPRRHGVPPSAWPASPVSTPSPCSLPLDRSPPKAPKPSVVDMPPSPALRGRAPPGRREPPPRRPQHQRPCPENINLMAHLSCTDGQSEHYPSEVTPTGWSAD